MKENLLEAKLDLAKELIKDASIYIKDNMYGNLDIDEKNDHTDLVTNIDKNVQSIIINKIKSNYPEDNFLAEENGQQCPINEGNVWVIDPIDGTANFVAQKDNFTVLLAYFEEGQGKFGLILYVMNDNLYWGDGKKVYKNNVELKKPSFDLKKSLIGVNSYMYRNNDHGLLDYSKETLGVRVLGSAGIEYINLIEGKISGYFSNLSPWDYAAATIILSAFDYVTENIEGGNPRYEGREKVITVARKNLDFIRQIIG